MQESDISAKVRQSRFSDPLSLQSKPLQPDYVSSYSSRSAPVRPVVSVGFASAVMRSVSCCEPMRKLETMTGMLRISVMMPAVATAEFDQLIGGLPTIEKHINLKAFG